MLSFQKTESEPAIPVMDISCSLEDIRKLEGGGSPGDIELKDMDLEVLISPTIEAEAAVKSRKNSDADQSRGLTFDVLISPTIEAAIKIRKNSEAADYHRGPAFSFSASSPDNAPTILTWSEVTVETKTDPKKLLIDNISGTISGGFWAIMGASGGGKTTLLSTLSLRIDTTKISVRGNMHLNGRKYNTKNLKAMSAYIMQDDLLHAELTVAEVVSYAAKLRLPKMSEEKRKFREAEVLYMMGISHVSNVIIGDSRNKGISGGERKRVSIAVELLTKPALVFLDEPTSGLDSTTALSVCTTLQQLAHDGICTVVCTIHQPSVKIFTLFDNLILMKKGHIVYQGSAQKSLLFLEHAGMPCPPGVNPADHLIDSITPKETTNAFDDNANKKVPVNLNVGSHLELKSMSVASLMSWKHQFVVLFQRSMQQYLRRKNIILMNFIITIIMAIFVSCGAWKDIGTTQGSVVLRTPSLFFASVSQGIVAALQCKPFRCNNACTLFDHI
jgi:ATP-binding cassette subfamily G (WHITE) protein 2